MPSGPGGPPPPPRRQPRRRAERHAAHDTSSPTECEPARSSPRGIGGGRIAAAARPGAIAESRGAGAPARISVASSAKRSRNSAARGGTVRVGRRRRRRTAMMQPAWNRGDGQPDRRRLDEALDRILEHCRPVEVILFGAAARGELQDSSDIDLLVVLADDDSAEPERMCFDICEAIGCQPRADVAVAFEKEVREAASAWPAPCTPGPRKDPALPPRLAAGLRARARPAAATGERCTDHRASWQEADWLWERTREELGLTEQCRDRLVA